MRVDKGEAQGTAAALLLHAVLVIALTSNLADVPKTPEPPAVEVELVDSDDVALTAAAPTPATPPPAAEAPLPVEEPLPSPPEPQPSPPPPAPAPAPTPAPAPPTPPPPAPVVRPAPPPVARPLPPRPSPPQQQRPAPPQPAPARPTPPRPTPQRPAPPRATPPQPAVAQPQPARPAPARPAPAPPRQSRIGDDFLRGIPNPDRDLSPREAAPGATTFSAAARASVDSAIKRQIQPCADRQPTLGPGADRIRVTVNLRLDRSGRLSRPPALVRISGVDGDNARFEDLAYDQAVAVFRACSPLRLPEELYSTPQGGWGNINLTYAAK